MTVGLTDKKVLKMRDVARACYDKAKKSGFHEGACRNLFLIGFLHGIGEEFTDDVKEAKEISGDMINYLARSVFLDDFIDGIKLPTESDDIGEMANEIVGFAHPHTLRTDLKATGM